MAMSARHRSKFAALRRQCWCLKMSENFSSGTKTPNKKQTNIKYGKISFHCIYKSEKFFKLDEKLQTNK